MAESQETAPATAPETPATSAAADGEAPAGEGDEVGMSKKAMKKVRDPQGRSQPSSAAEAEAFRGLDKNGKYFSSLACFSFLGSVAVKLAEIFSCIACGPVGAFSFGKSEEFPSPCADQGCGRAS